MSSAIDRYGVTRDALHRVAAHILSRRRHIACGRVGLRATPGGFGTPAFELPTNGPTGATTAVLECLRISGASLVRESGDLASAKCLRGASLGDLAQFSNIELDVDFRCGAESPALGDVSETLRIDEDAAKGIADWFAFGATVLDGVIAARPIEVDAAAVQLWPEHFDLATTVGGPNGSRVNVGFSPGDTFEPAPYAYVGPWGESRPGSDGYWNAPFGAVLREADLLDGVDRRQVVHLFVLEGLERVGLAETDPR